MEHRTEIDNKIEESKKVDTYDDLKKKTDFEIFTQYQPPRVGEVWRKRPREGGCYIPKEKIVDSIKLDIGGKIWLNNGEWNKVSSEMSHGMLKSTINFRYLKSLYPHLHTWCLIKFIRKHEFAYIPLSTQNSKEDKKLVKAKVKNKINII